MYKFIVVKTQIENNQISLKINNNIGVSFHIQHSFRDDVVPLYPCSSEYKHEMTVILQHN